MLCILWLPMDHWHASARRYCVCVLNEMTEQKEGTMKPELVKRGEACRLNVIRRSAARGLGARRQRRPDGFPAILKGCGRHFGSCAAARSFRSSRRVHAGSCLQAALLSCHPKRSHYVPFMGVASEKASFIYTLAFACAMSRSPCAHLCQEVHRENAA